MNAIYFVSQKFEGELIMYKFEIFKGRDSQFYWRFKAPNGETMCVSEGSTAKHNAQSAIDSVKANASTASVVDLTASRVA